MDWIYQGHIHLQLRCQEKKACKQLKFPKPYMSNWVEPDLRNKKLLLNVNPTPFSFSLLLIDTRESRQNLQSIWKLGTLIEHPIYRKKGARCLVCSKRCVGRVLQLVILIPVVPFLDAIFFDALNRWLQIQLGLFQVLIWFIEEFSSFRKFHLLISYNPMLCLVHLIFFPVI